MRLSALVVAHNEAAQLAECLATLRFADEIVVVLDRTTDRSPAVAEEHGARIVEGTWPIEGDRRSAGIDACRGEWILEVDADERVPPELAKEIDRHLPTAHRGYFLVPFANHIGHRLVRYGWGAYNGVGMKPCLFARGCKTWGRRRVHPRIELSGHRSVLTHPMTHYVYRDVADAIQRLNRYSSLNAEQMREDGTVGTLWPNLRRMLSRFWKSYVARRGYREGAYGLLLGLFAALYPILSYLKARIAEDEKKDTRAR
ncbi:MAG: glycosyltransferase family 2 protein [Alphaproteobacteria bacterium]|nr:glycosyltransferase family 2 protein [Alphaproteobacteria bacterium]